jgi:YfiR/HmsC-like
MRSRAISFLGLNVLWLLLLSGSGRAQNSPPTEYQIKAAFIFNFARFIEWPPKAFAGTTSPLVIGILGDNPFRDDLRRTLRDKTVDDHPLVIKELSSHVEATNCHILFISTSEKPRLAQVLQGLKGASVVTVAEMDRFTENGGMINFVQEGTKIRFQINNEAAMGAGLKISSKLLSLALRPGG